MKSTTLSTLSLFYFLRSSLSFTVTSYPTLEEAYEERLITNSLYGPVDLLWFEDVDKFKEICAKLSQSSIYTMLSPNEILKPPEERKQFQDETKVSDADVRYQSLSVKFANNRTRLVPVNLFPCPMKINSQNWYIGYGFSREDIRYLFVRPTIDTDIKLEALIEPPSRLDKTMSHNETYLEKNFIHIVSRKKRVEANEDPLCSLNAIQLFRLCSAINNVVQTDARFYINYVEHYSKRRSSQLDCLQNQQIVLDEMNESPGKYSEQEIRVNVVPCAINTVAESPSFYLTSNPGEENAVFLLHEFVDRNSSIDEKLFKVQAHIRDISVLKYVVDLF